MDTINLEDRGVTLEQVKQYILAEHTGNPNLLQQDINQFITERDIATFWWLHDWHAQFDFPPSLPLPRIVQYCWAFQYAPGAEPITFEEGMKRYYQRCLDYCNENRVNPDNPAETPEQRKARLNRERMAKVRAGRKAAKSTLEDLPPEVVEELRLLEAKRDGLKAEAKQVDEQLAERVRGFQQQMVEAAEERKRAKEYFRNEIDIVTNDIVEKQAKQVL